jgi:hypothetical protein
MPRLAADEERLEELVRDALVNAKNPKRDADK